MINSMVFEVKPHSDSKSTNEKLDNVGQITLPPESQ